METAFELGALGVGAVTLLDAARAGRRWLAFALAALAYALTFELLVSNEASGGFHYGAFLIALPGGAPLWVPVGWMALITAAARTAERLSDSRWRPALAALLVALTGWVLDPVAVALGWWGWSAPGQPLVLGAPAGNYLAWIFVALAFTGLVDAGWRWRASAWVPVVAAPLALGLVAALSMVSQLPVDPRWTLAAISLVVIAAAARTLPWTGPSARPAVVLPPAFATLGCAALMTMHGLASWPLLLAGAASVAAHALNPGSRSSASR